VQIFRMLAFVTYFLLSLSLLAQETTLGSVEVVPTREGVAVTIFSYWKSDAVATVVLFSGGGGGYGQIGDDGWPSSGNFLIRTGKHWVTYPFNLVMVGRPSDGIDLALGGNRIGEKHAADNVAIFKAIKARSQIPIWLVGTSMGTISAAAAATQDTDNLVSGIVLTSSIVGYKVPGAVPKQNLDRVRVPTLIFHHEDDACWACRPNEVKSLASAFTNAPVIKTIFVSGGSGVTGNPCEPMHHHGFVGMQDEAVDLLARWILNPTE
jgi:hypothetical protein